jgi:hypothetical protein
VGTYGGLLASWDPNIFSFEPFLSTGGILLTGYTTGDKKELTFLNVYGPCQNRKEFCESVEAAGLLRKINIILVGDLNLSTSSSKTWGKKATSDPLSVYFKSLFQRHSLIDVIPNKPLPTWKNGRASVESISKRLDRFYIAEELLVSSQKYRSWVQLPFISDHAPICLELGQGFQKVYFPYKFNPGWIAEEGFTNVVENIWQDSELSSIQDAQLRLVEKLTKLKSCVKLCAKNKHIRDTSDL